MSNHFPSFKVFIFICVGEKSLHVEEGTWVCGCACTHAHVKARANLRCHSLVASRLIFETVIWGTQIQTDRWTNEFQEPSCLPLSSTSLQVHTTMPDFLHRYWELNSSPHTWAKRFFFLSIKPCFNFFFTS